MTNTTTLKQHLIFIYLQTNYINHSVNQLPNMFPNIRMHGYVIYNGMLYVYMYLYIYMRLSCGYIDTAYIHIYLIITWCLNLAFYHMTHTQSEQAYAAY